MTSSSTLPAGGRDYFYWYVETEDTGLGPVEVRIGDGPWRPTEAAADTAGRPGWRVLIAGPDAPDNPLGTVVVPLGQTRTQARIIDTEIPFGSGRIDCR